MKNTDRIDRLRIASPCPANWAQMTGDDRVRFCDLCNLHVYNLAELTRTEAESLIANSEGRTCARLYRRSDGTVITKDCPVGLRALRRRAAKVAGVVFAAFMSLVGSVAGQKPAASKSSCTKQVTITRAGAQSSSENGVISGTILDQNGALVAGAKITITNRKTKETYHTSSNAEGRYLIAYIPPGTYDIIIKSPGFKNLGVTKISLAGKETANLEVVLLVDGSMLMGVIAESPLIDTSSSSTTIIISGETLRRLPIP
ncbi:MAG TPA: carboxypeptidase-like regulatory domain-containing protein [Pyrinomonadaceae bacterium]|nr:carboxypeptidase-like regulatory domain-containing protein [Pyrinomonadaceae bacterium]